VAAARDRNHRKRLDESRSFTASLRAELLLMHGGAVRADVSLAPFDALHRLLERVLGEPVSHSLMCRTTFF
jgi:hypothetical protein